MPFTPFHLGPGLGLGLPLRKHLHAPTFLLASVIVDVEPFLVFFLGLRYPLHGYLHTFLLAIPIGLLLGYIMFLLEKFLQPLYKTFLLEAGNSLSLKSFVVAGGLGTGAACYAGHPALHRHNTILSNNSKSLLRSLSYARNLQLMRLDGRFRNNILLRIIRPFNPQKTIKKRECSK